MTTGRLIAVVGPSGVGKDSVMQGINAVVPQSVLVRRVTTRAANLGGEIYDAVTEAQFQQMVTNGAFAIHWDAHNLRYGIPKEVDNLLASGIDCLANFSRTALEKGAKRFERFVVLSLTASPEVLAARLKARGRETQEDIANRLRRAVNTLPEGLDIIEISNDGALEETVARAIARLHPVKA